jgi:hypothetical protein
MTFWRQINLKTRIYFSGFRFLGFALYETKKKKKKKKNTAVKYHLHIIGPVDIV